MIQVELIPTFPKFDPVIHQIGMLLQMELKSGRTQSKLYSDGLTTALSAHLLRQYCTVKQSLDNHKNGLPKYVLRRALDYIQAHLSDDLSLKAIAEELGISQYYFCRLFKQSTGMTPHQYVVQQRVELSKQLLNQREFTIIEISSECGFANPSHFAKCFRKYTGISPKQFRMI